MDMEAEMVYADILRTLQSSILNTNVSLQQWEAGVILYGSLLINTAPGLLFTMSLCKLWFGILKSLATVKPLRSTGRAACFILSSHIIFA